MSDIREASLQAEFRLKYNRYWQECVRFVNSRNFLSQPALSTLPGVTAHRVDGNEILESPVSFAELYLRYVDKPPQFEAPKSKDPGPDDNDNNDDEDDNGNDDGEGRGQAMATDQK
jgi:hypothetical protein